MTIQEADFITGCNHMIKMVMKWYSSHLQSLDKDYPDAEWDISPLLLHDTILMEIRSFTLKYKAFKKKEKELMLKNLREQLDDIQNSNESDDITKLKMLKKVIQDVGDSDDMEKATQLLAWYNL